MAGGNKIGPYDFELDAEEAGIMGKALDAWWIRRKRRVTRRFVAKGRTISITMWDGKHYDIEQGRFSATYEWDVTHGRDNTFFKIFIKTDDKQKIIFYEMQNMYPKGRDDTERMLQILEARPRKWVNIGSKVAKVANVLKKSR